VGGGVNSGDGGDEGEGEGEESEERARAEKRNGVVARLVPDVERLHARGYDARDGFEVVDARAEVVGGDCKRESEERQRERGETENETEQKFVGVNDSERVPENFEWANYETE